tara:strand:+ start:63 stop:1211 length:1149 start_codon:yes stop_codon:yes gene_type:complete
MMANISRITTVSFLTYFIFSAMLAPIGIITGPMAEHFDQTVSDVTRQFGWLTGGNFVGAVIALVIFDYLGLKKLFTVIYGLIAASLIALRAIDNLDTASYLLGLVGLGSGIGLAGAAITISRSYTEARRASMLVITDGCFSVAGFLVSWAATFLVTQALGWSLTYQLLSLFAVATFLLALVSSFPAVEQDRNLQETGGAWPLPVWLCIISLFLYTLGQYSMLFWLPNYAITQLGATEIKAGGLVGQFWLGMFLAQVFVAWWVMKVGVRLLVKIATVTTCLFSVPLWLFTAIDGLLILALLWGFANLSLLKATISLATEMVVIPSARLVSLLLLGATIGTAVSPFVTSQIVDWTSNHTILIFGSACYGVLTLLIFIALRYNRP